MPKSTIIYAALAALLALFLAGAPHPVAAQEIGPDQSLTITFLGCPPGGDWSGPPAGCADVVPAPASAVVTGADWMQRVSELEPNADGTYSVPLPAGGTIGLVDFFSPKYNAFTFGGVDTISRWYGEVSLEAGESREITVFYWNGPVDLIMPPENTLVVNVLTCGEGVDPTIDASGCVPATGDLPGLEVATPPLRQVEMDDYLTRQGGTLTYAGLPPYTQAQVSVRQPMTGYNQALITGDADVIGEETATAFLLRNETRTIDVYFYAPTGEPVPTPADEPERGTGTLRLSLLSCPEGVVPHDDPGRCTETMRAMETAMVSFPATGERLSLSRFEQDESGAYVIPGIRDSVTISGVLSTDGRRIASDADEIHGEEVVYRVEAGQTRDGRLYYYDDGR